MSYNDFIANWHKVEICNLGPTDSHLDKQSETATKRWEASTLEGCWKPKVTAGGCRNYIGG